MAISSARKLSQLCVPRDHPDHLSWCQSLCEPELLLRLSGLRQESIMHSHGIHYNLQDNCSVLFQATIWIIRRRASNDFEAQHKKRIWGTFRINIRWSIKWVSALTVSKARENIPMPKMSALPVSRSVLEILDFQTFEDGQVTAGLILEGVHTSREARVAY